MGFVDPVRLCAPCAAVTRREQQFFDAGMKALLAGAPFHVRSSATIAGDSPLYSVRLSQDERTLVFEAHDAADGGGGEDLGPVELTRIVEEAPGQGGDEDNGGCFQIAFLSKYFSSLCELFLSQIMIDYLFYKNSININFLRNSMTWIFQSNDYDISVVEFMVSFRVRETATDDLQLWLECPKEPSRKPSAIWIEAFNRVMK